MKVLAIVVLCLVAYVSSTPLERKKRATMAFAGGFPFGGFGGFAGGGAYAGPGFGWPVVAASPWDYSRAFFPYPQWPVFTFPTPWYEGENVCKTTKEIQDPVDLQEWFSETSSSDLDSNHEMEQCQDTFSKHVCFQRYVKNGESKMKATKAECCHGFVRNPAGPGCVEIDLKDLLPTLRDMGAFQMVNIIKEAKMKNTFHSGNFTVFCPRNSALEAYVEDRKTISGNEVLEKYRYRKFERKRNIKTFVKNHMVKGFIKLDDFKDGKNIETENGVARINIYYIPEKVITVNCVHIKTADYFAKNGIIHLVERVLPVPTKSVADIIAADAQFSLLKGMLSKAGLVQTLRSLNNTFTVFAPTDSALKQFFKEKESRTNNKCISRLLKHHIIDHVICSQAIPQFAKSMNMVGELLSLSRDFHNKLYVDDVQIVVRDLMATNGVVHIIDGILYTRQANSVSKVMEKYGLREFLSLLEMANLRSYFDSMDNVTFFVPSDDSLQSISPNHLESFMYDAEALREVLLYHVGIGESEINASETEMSSRLENTTLRIQVHLSYPHSTPQALVQCATILSSGNKVCGGTLHVINKVLLPPKLSLMQLLENIEGFSTLVLLLKVTGLESRLREPNARLTLLAPTDDAFHLMGQGQLFRIFEDLLFAADLVKMHILSGIVCCSQLKSDLQIGRSLIRAIDGSTLRLDRTRNGILTVADARVVDCDIMATNGPIHMLDSVLLQKTGDNILIRI